MLLLATCCTIAALGAPAPDPHLPWEPLGDDPARRIEVDRVRIVRDGGLVDVWIRLRGDRAAVAREFEAAGEDAASVGRVRASLDHSRHRWSFHCDDGTHALAVSAFFADDGTLIRAFEPARRDWWPVQPDTVGQRLLGLACGPGGTTAGPLADPGRAPEDAAHDGHAPADGDGSRRADDAMPARPR